MKTITIILLAAIIIIGAIGIIITKLYYRNKENNENNLNFNNDFGINNYYNPEYDNFNKKFNESKQIGRRPNSQQKEVQRQRRELNSFSQSIPSTNNINIFDDYYDEPIINSKFVNKDSKNSQTIIKPEHKKTEEIKRIINNKSENIRPSIQSRKDAKIINLNKQGNQNIASKISQAPMTKEQKEFIDQKKGKLIIDNEGKSGIKVIESNSEEKKEINNSKENNTKFGEITRVNITNNSEGNTLKIKEIANSNLEETLNELIKNSDIESTASIEEIRNEIAYKEEKQKEETNKDKSYIGKLPIFKKADKPKIGETTLDDHQYQGYFEDIPNTDDLESKNSDEEEEYPEDVITPIYNDPKSAVSGAVQSLKNLRSSLINEEEEEEYEDDFISITPLSEDEIQAELTEESATITPIEENLSNENNVSNFIEEESKRMEAKMKLQELRESNTKKLFNMSKEEIDTLETISKQNIKEKSEVKIENITPQVTNDQVVIDGEVYELRKGLTGMFKYNNESYSGEILAPKPGYIGVKYRRENLWIKNTRITKIFKF